MPGQVTTVSPRNIPCHTSYSAVGAQEKEEKVRILVAMAYVFPSNILWYGSLLKRRKLNIGLLIRSSE